jgi:2'-5' RNA ligase
MRLFVAADLDDKFRTAVSGTVGEVRDQLTTAGVADQVRWVDGDHLHLTLQFIGYVDDDRGAAIRSGLEAPLASPPCRISLAGIGAFPRGGAARVIWLGVDSGAEALRAVHDEVGRRLEAAGCSPEERQFRAHLTIGRVRNPEKRLTHRFLKSLSLDAPGSCTITHITLYESRLSAAGATYLPLLQTALDGAA